MKLFCKGIGVEHPDITNASRAMKSPEADLCKKAGVEFQEFVGNDGVAFSNSNKGQAFKISILLCGCSQKTLLLMAKSILNNLMTWDKVDAYVAQQTQPTKIDCLQFRSR